MKILNVKSGRSCRIEIPVHAGNTQQGKVVLFHYDGKRLAGIVKAVTAEGPVVELTLPDVNGVLHGVGSEMVLKGVSFELSASAVVSPERRKLKLWNAELAIKTPGARTYAVYADPKDDKSEIVDYKNVVVEGYLSTFVGTTPKDRDGDYVEEHAFDKTLARFKENPVMLIDHRNSVESLAGSFTKIGVSSEGLMVQGLLSNAPGLRDTRFKVVEGHLKSMSMGGIFYYKDDGRGIQEVELFEGSLTPVPANPDAQFMVREVTAKDAILLQEKRIQWG